MIGSIIKAIVGVAELMHMFSSRKDEVRTGSCDNRMRSLRQDQEARRRREQMQSFWWVFTAFIALLFSGFGYMVWHHFFPK